MPVDTTTIIITEGLNIVLFFFSLHSHQSCQQLKILVFLYNRDGIQDVF